jgi:hypothetical protein
MSKALPQAFNAFGQPVIQLTEFYEILSPHAPDMAGSGDKAQRTAHPTQRLGPKYSRKFSGGLNAVLQGYNNSVRTYQWTHCLGGLRHLPSLYANKNSVHTTNLCGIVGCLRPYDGFACRGLKAQTSSPERAEMIAPSNENNIVSGERELCTKVAAGASCPEDCDAHLALPKFVWPTAIKPKPIDQKPYHGLRRAGASLTRRDKWPSAKLPNKLLSVMELAIVLQQIRGNPAGK